MAFIVVMNPTPCIICNKIVHALIRSQEELTTFKCQECIDKEVLTNENINSILEENITPMLPETEGGDPEI